MAISASQPYSAPLTSLVGIPRLQNNAQRVGAYNKAASVTNQEQIDQVQLSPAARQAYAATQLSPEQNSGTTSLPLATAQQSPDNKNTVTDGKTVTATERTSSPYSAYEQNEVSTNTTTSDNSNSVDSVQLSPEAQQQLLELAQRDREVQIHEAAHAAVGGRYTGAPKLSYTTGPDGKRYATSGEVNVDMSEVPGDPAATIKKAETIHAAALAPAQPSAQDRNVAAKALQMKAKAQAELMQESATASAEMLGNSAVASSPQEAAQQNSVNKFFSGTIA